MAYDLTLSPAAQALVYAAIKAANENGDQAAIDRALEKAVVDLSFSLPPGQKAQVTDALIEIAKAYVRTRLLTDPIVGSFPATTVQKERLSSAVRFKLDVPVRNVEYATADVRALGIVPFWEKIGSGNPVGTRVTIMKMAHDDKGFLVVKEFSLLTPDEMRAKLLNKLHLMPTIGEIGSLSEG